MNKLTRNIYILSFCVIICLPVVFWSIFGKYFDSENRENRELAKKESMFMLPEDYEEYFNDNLPFRNNLISINSNINYYLFHVSQNKDVIIGKDGWLFYERVDDGNFFACYQGDNLFSDKELEQIASHLENIRKELEKQDIEFVVFIAPNKERIYSEMMPDYYGEPSQTYATLQLVEYLEENTGVRVVYPYDELMEAKSKLDGNLIYYKTDTHWNELGGYVGAKALLEELDITMPDITSEDIIIEESDYDSGDLLQLLGMSGLDDKAYHVSGYKTNNVELIEWDFETLIHYKAECADERRIYIYRDSFASSMAEYIGSHFSETYMVYKEIYTYEDFVDKKPDIFVFQVVERYVASEIMFNLKNE